MEEIYRSELFSVPPTLQEGLFLQDCVVPEREKKVVFRQSSAKEKHGNLSTSQPRIGQPTKGAIHRPRSHI